MARLPYLSESELLDQQHRLLAPYDELGDDFTPHVDSPSDEYSKDQATGPPQLYRALLHNPALLRSFRRTASDLRAECGLNERYRELVILTIARTIEAEYEWHQHVRIALAGSVTAKEIQSIEDSKYDLFDDPEAALIEYTENAVLMNISNKHHAALADHFDTEIIVGIVMLVQFYLGLAYLIDALGIELEDEFVGWTLENVDRLSS